MRVEKEVATAGTIRRRRNLFPSAGRASFGWLQFGILASGVIRRGAHMSEHFDRSAVALKGVPNKREHFRKQAFPPLRQRQSCSGKGTGDPKGLASAGACYAEGSTSASTLIIPCTSSEASTRSGNPCKRSRDPEASSASESNVSAARASAESLALSPSSSSSNTCNLSSSRRDFARVRCRCRPYKYIAAVSVRPCHASSSPGPKRR